MPKGARIYSGVLGGVSWSPNTVVEANGLVYVAAMHCPVVDTLHEKTANGNKPTIRYSVIESIEEARWSLVSAVDLNSDYLRWQHNTPKPHIGELLTTASGLILPVKATAILMP